MITALFIGADMDVSYTSAIPALDSDGNYLNTGTCTWSLTDQDDTELGSGDLTYDTGSDGDYYGVIESTVTSLLTEGAPYTLTITFEDGEYDDERVIPLRAAYRQAT